MNKLTLILACVFCSLLYSSQAADGASRSKYDHIKALLGSNTIESLENNSLKEEDGSSSNMTQNVLFYLFTRSNKDDYQQLKINDTDSVKLSNFNSTKSTTFIVHGYMDNIDAEVITLIKDNLLDIEDQNVFGVDWSAFCMTILYDDAVKMTQPVGYFFGSFLEFLAGEGMDLNRTHLIGHSLGAHVAGFAGSFVGQKRISRVTGLDPAKPGFENAGPEGRLDSSDAAFVDCIHTCAGDLGLGKPVCLVDFYPNGGENLQPGCPWYDFVGTCSHSRSYQYYAESMQTGHEFKAVKCWEVPITNTTDICSNTPSNLMGYPATFGVGGYFYVQTNSNYPFAQE